MRSLCCGATILRGFTEEEVEDGDELPWRSSTRMVSSSISASDSDESGLRRRRCSGRSWAGVDLGLGGGVMMRDKSLFAVRRWRGTAVAPECRRGRMVWTEMDIRSKIFSGGYS